MIPRAELFRALGAMSEPPEPGHAPIAAALGLPGAPAPGDHAEVFLFGAYPYASVYLGPEGMVGGEARDRVAGFWRALRLVPPAEPDHLAALLGLYAALVEAEATEPDRARATLRRSSRKALLWEHLLSWLPPYLAKVEEIGAPFYSAWARLLMAALVEEAGELGYPDDLPLQLRASPGLPGPEAAAEAWVGALLASVRSGVVLTRSDLRRASKELAIGARVAERAFMLRAMLEQDAGGTASWLASEARRAAEAYGSLPPAFDPVAGFWRDRAEACEAALRAVPGM